MNQTRLIPLRDFFRNPDKTGFKISPDGTKISFLAPYKNRQNVMVRDLKTNKESRITEDTERDIKLYFWKSDLILYLQDSGGDENFQLFSCMPDKMQVKPLTPFPGVLTQIIDRLDEDNQHIIIGLNKRNPEIFDPYKLNVITGELELLYENPGNITSWYTDHTGTIRLAGITDGVNTSIVHRKNEKEDFQELINLSFKDTLIPQFFTFDNENLYAISNLGRDKAAVVLFDLNQAKEVEVLYENPKYDVSGLDYSKKFKKITYAEYTSWKEEHLCFDDEYRQLLNDLNRDFAGFEVAITSRTEEEDKLIVRTYSDKCLGSYYLYDVKTKFITKLSDVSPWLNAEELCDQQPIAYESRDGVKIQGYLTLPKVADKKNLPVVVNPHGGPWHRDVWGFNPEVQFLANRGFAVLQMNFRGSTGFGRKFWELSFKQWGRSMQDDITDGVKWLINEGIADKNRIAIYGASYGGYACLAGLTFTPDLYAAGIDYVGVSNLFTFMNTIPPYWKPYLEMMYEMVGNPEKDKELLAERSPVLHAHQIKAPLLIAQGANDPRVNQDESEQIVNALKSNGIKVQYILKENEGHGFANEENQFEFYEAMEAFLNLHLKMDETSHLQEVKIHQKQN